MSETDTSADPKPATPSSKPPKPKNPEREQRQLLCKLTEPEMLARGDEMAECENTIAVLKDKRRGLNGKIADLAERRGKLAKVIDSGSEERAVDCVWIDDIKQNCKDLVRQDTGEKVDTRPLTAADLQTGLDLGGGGPDDDDDEDGDDDDETVTVVTASTGRGKRGNGKTTRHAHA